MNQGQLDQKDQYVGQKDQINRQECIPGSTIHPRVSLRTPTVFPAVPGSICQPTDTKPDADLLIARGGGYSQVLRLCKQVREIAQRCTMLPFCCG